MAKKETKKEEISQEPTKKEEVVESNFMKTLLSTIATTMKEGEGSGVDSPQVRQIIKDYLNTDKIKLSELDNSVIEEIRKNQKVFLEIPGFSKPIEVKKSDAEIPNFYEIIDDVMAGNNVYLIGEAGGGKTYTAEKIASILGRNYVTMNCSQYTSPLEILGGQSVEGFKQGKLIDCWKNGKILILDEMPKLDPNTAGLFNDALAKSTKTKPKSEAKINSANAEEPPIERNDNFGLIATGNIYPNAAPPEQYRGNNQQDLSLLDRFSGSVYFTEFSEITDDKTTRFRFLKEFLVGNYYTYIKDKKEGRTPPTPRGLRTVIESIPAKNFALVSYRTNTSFRIAFEYELVRAIARKEGKNIPAFGKTLAKTFESYMVAFLNNRDTYNNIISQTGYTETYIQNLVDTTINGILSGETGFYNALNPSVQELSEGIFKRYNDFYAAEPFVINK